MKVSKTTSDTAAIIIPISHQLICGVVGTSGTDGAGGVTAGGGAGGVGGFTSAGGGDGVGLGAGGVTV